MSHYHLKFQKTQYCNVDIENEWDALSYSNRSYKKGLSFTHKHTLGHTHTLGQQKRQQLWNHVLNTAAADWPVEVSVGVDGRPVLDAEQSLLFLPTLNPIITQQLSPHLLSVPCQE